MHLRILASLFINSTIFISLIRRTNGTTFQWTADVTWQRSLQHPGNAICVDIPSNMSLCHGIGYTKMRLPNLLHHDSLQEVSQQAISWIPLFQLNCHPDTQIFLCSLFTPVCLDHPIPPCRSLCLTVQSSCEDTMSKYGYPWPHIVRCDQFPVDNNMCIMAQHGLAGGVVGLPSEPENASNSRPVQLYPDGTPKGILVPSTQAGKDESVKKKKKRKGKKNRKVVPLTTTTSASNTFSSTEAFPHDLKTSGPSTPHVHHHLQTMTEQQEAAGLDVLPPAADETEIYTSSITSSSENKVHVQERILSGYCHSDWGLKVKAAAMPDSDGSITLHVKSYRLLWATQTSDMRPSLITIPGNVSQDVSTAFDSTETVHARVTEQDKARFYVMGNNKGNMYVANYAIFWPHKSPPFRKALKDIQTGSVECLSTSTVAPFTVSAAPNHREQHSRGQKRRRGKKERKKLHQHHHHHDQNG